VYSTVWLELKCYKKDTCRNFVVVACSLMDFTRHHIHVAESKESRGSVICDSKTKHNKAHYDNCLCI
jgi:hypothetical protein